MVKDGVKVRYPKAVGLLIFSFVANQESKSSVEELIQIKRPVADRELNNPITIRIKPLVASFYHKQSC